MRNFKKIGLILSWHGFRKRSLRLALNSGVFRIFQEYFGRLGEAEPIH